MIENMSVADLSRAYREAELSPVEVVTFYLDRIDQLDERLNAVCSSDREAAIDGARRAESRIANDSAAPGMCGIPFVAKDLIFTTDLPTTGGSPIYRDFLPGEDDATVARLLADEGILLGKANTAEFGFSGNHTTNAVHGRTRNPWDPDRSTGGSSGGSAAAVAGRLAPIALGSDGGGSIRIPSAFCGLYGHKPTFGLVPLYPGCRDPAYPGFSGWESIEHIGPIARTPMDAAIMLDAISGLHQGDRHSVPWSGPSFAKALESTQGLSGVRVAYSPDWGGRLAVDQDLRAEVERIAEVLSDLGATVAPGQPEFVDTIKAFGTIVAVDMDPAAIEALAADNDGEVGDRILAIAASEGTLATVGEAQRVRQQISLSISRFLDEVDLWLTPTVPVVAFSHELVGPELVGGSVPRDPNRAILDFVHPFNLTGHPAASLPTGLSEGLPMGVQLVGRRFEDAAVLRAAEAIRLSGNWLNLPPDPVSETAT